MFLMCMCVCVCVFINLFCEIKKMENETLFNISIFKD
jgi:hypothetical protein